MEIEELRLTTSDQIEIEVFPFKSMKVSVQVQYSNLFMHVMSVLSLNHLNSSENHTVNSSIFSSPFIKQIVS